MLGLQRVLHVLCQCHLTCAVYGQTVDKQRQLAWKYIIPDWTFGLAVKSSESTSDEGTDRIQYVSGSSMHCYAKPKNEGEFMRIEVKNTTPSAIAKFKTWSCWWLEAFLLRTITATLFFFMLGSSRSCQYAVSMCPDPSSSWSVKQERMISDDTIQQQKSIHPHLPRPLQHSASELLLRQAVLDLSASESLRFISSFNVAIGIAV